MRMESIEFILAVLRLKRLNKSWIRLSLSAIELRSLGFHQYCYDKNPIKIPAIERSRTLQQGIKLMWKVEYFTGHMELLGKQSIRNRKLLV